VSGPVTAIDVVVAEDLPGEFRRQEVDLVGRLRAAEDSGGLATMGLQTLAESLGGAIECFVPGSGPKDAVVADERLRQAGVCARRVGTGLHRVHLQDGNGVRRMHGGCSPGQVVRLMSSLGRRLRRTLRGTLG